MFAIIGSAVTGSLLFSGIALAAGPGGFGHWSMGGRAPGVFGTVSTINGSTLTVTSNPRGNATTTVSTTVYTVDASNATVTKNGSASSLSNVSVGDMVMVAGTVNGTNVTATSIRDGMMGRGARGMKPGVFGTIGSISGSSLTVTSKMGPGGTADSAYTVDATNATVTKNGASSSVSNLAVGDTVMVQGTINGTSVTATAIRDGAMGGQRPPMPAIQGNGEPVIGGNVTAVNGPTLTVTNRSNITYTVDASSAAVTKGNATSSLSSVSVGDSVIMQGTVNGTSVTASSVIDQGNGTVPPNSTSTGSGGHRMGFMGSIFGAIGGFFQHLFGF